MKAYEILVCYYLSNILPKFATLYHCILRFLFRFFLLTIEIITTNMFTTAWRACASVDVSADAADVHVRLIYNDTFH